MPQRSFVAMQLKANGKVITRRQIGSFKWQRKKSCALWLFRSTSDDYILSVFVVGSIEIDVYLRGPDANDLVGFIPVLRQVAQSVQVLPAK
jgi:hypothetical protein